VENEVEIKNEIKAKNKSSDVSEDETEKMEVVSDIAKL